MEFWPGAPNVGVTPLCIGRVWYAVSRDCFVLVSYCESGHYLDSLDLNPTTFMKCIILINYILSNTFKRYGFSFNFIERVYYFVDVYGFKMDSFNLSFSSLTNTPHRSRDSILKYDCLQCCQLQK